VPQQRSLLPFLDVWGNVVFGLERHKRRRGNPEVVELLEELGIAGLAGARPQSLSGGEAQKVALARALAVSPGLLLLDEPFSSVDHASRARLLATVSATLKTRSLPALLVTHDPEEVRAVADEVVLIEGGRTRAQGPVSELLGPTP
jgi:ABC-type nitrate/sulfonate/bicarbonate transport system ATPase subunit